MLLIKVLFVEFACYKVKLLVLSGPLSACSLVHVKMYRAPTEGKYHIAAVIHEYYFKMISPTGGG